MYHLACLELTMEVLLVLTLRCLPGAGFEGPRNPFFIED